MSKQNKQILKSKQPQKKENPKEWKPAISGKDEERYMNFSQTLRLPKCVTNFLKEFPQTGKNLSKNAQFVDNFFNSGMQKDVLWIRKKDITHPATSHLQLKQQENLKGSFPKSVLEDNLNLGFIIFLKNKSVKISTQRRKVARRKAKALKKKAKLGFKSKRLYRIKTHLHLKQHDARYKLPKYCLPFVSRFNHLQAESSLNWADFLSLHHKWKQYASRHLELAQSKPYFSSEVSGYYINHCICQLDLHGCFVKIIEAKAKRSLQNFQGIILQVSKNRIVFISQSPIPNRLIHLPLVGTEFSFTIKERLFCIHGTHYRNNVVLTIAVYIINPKKFVFILNKAIDIKKKDKEKKRIMEPKQYKKLITNEKYATHRQQKKKGIYFFFAVFPLQTTDTILKHQKKRQHIQRSIFSAFAGENIEK
ncbi:hypothetical protein RFI_32600 [Reticulomyxa filosa]|uniref:Uncharacterized protein n=1 Tax=Reticulomyxa filosa TaxID=46433 RepID=X6LVQ5_RETFI|nr:hypothetical protein RFI_32600 [Reticulomyxa filosa]|eukprot:ETO04795.1 hypothetical protein RFI_32600 [Reticulomyxa filosa]